MYCPQTYGQVTEALVSENRKATVQPTHHRHVAQTPHHSFSQNLCFPHFLLSVLLVTAVFCSTAETSSPPSCDSVLAAGSTL